MSVIIPAGTPAGSIMLFAGAATNPAPDGWLWCDGAEYNAVDYPTLAAACNSMYGTASAGMFRVPNMSGRVAIASGNDGTTTRNPGETPGAATHTLSLTEMPSHVHTFADVQVSNSSGQYLWAQGPAHPGASSIYGNVGSWDANQSGTKVRGDFLGSAIRATGGSGAHNNIQPSAVVGGYIIKT